MEKAVMETNWREEKRTEMFDRVMVAVAASYAEAQENGDARWINYLDSQLFPFLEAERERAELEEAFKA